MRLPHQKAIEIVQKAIENNRAQNHQQACKEYLNALDYFMLALKYEKNDQFKVLKKNLTTNAAPGTLAAKRITKVNSDTAKLRAGLAEAIISTSNSSSSRVTWDDIAGLDAVLIPLMFPHLFAGKRRPWRGILLYGLPGTGKSFLAKEWRTRRDARRVREAGQAPLRDGPRDATSGHLHGRGRLTHERAREGESEASRRLKTEFLVQMDEVRRDDSEAGILVIGAGQDGCPTECNISHGSRRAKEAGLMGACSPADPDAVQKSWSELVRRPEEVHDPVITMADFEEVLKNVRPSVTVKDSEGHMRWTQEFGSYGA
ncbi:AAA-domain-containing protein [Mycena kentingensis (nom. inval.)]|nr:AAA-domain-containing protein [Mycena kentingensis (nom. inval.)]